MILLFLLLLSFVIFPAIERRYPGISIPPFLNFPTLHVRVYLALSLGMLDSASYVLFDVKSNPGWKFFGALIGWSAVAFMAYFVSKGQSFALENHFVYDKDFPKEMKFFSLNGLYFFYKKGSLEIGRYTRTDGGDVNYPLGVFFNRFVPGRQ